VAHASNIRDAIGWNSYPSRRLQKRTRESPASVRQSFKFKQIQAFRVQTAQAPAPYDRRVRGDPGIMRSPRTGATILGHGRIKILGQNYRFNQSRPVTGTIKTVTVRRDALHDIHITFSCDQVLQTEQAPKTGLSAGADFGLKDFLTLSTGEKIAAPQPLKAELRHLRKAQRVLSRKQKGSKARNRARLDVARVHRKVANDWQWKTARMLLLTFDLLAFETLNLRGMQQLWGRKVGDLSFADFLRKAGWLARKLGRDLLKIDQWEPSTKTCRACGRRREMPLNMRIFVCEGCGYVEHRDVNASHNILEAGRRLRSGASSKTAHG